MQLEFLKLRAEMLSEIRSFFRSREVLEVETPLLYPFTNPSPFLAAFEVEREFLQTSPEFAMKRLLALGSGDIYQICKAFRKEEMGDYHNPEFSILEWYRIGFDHHQLIMEVLALLQHFFPKASWRKVSYQQIFQEYCRIDPFNVSLANLKVLGKEYQLYFPQFSKNQWLESLFSLVVEPQLNKEEITFVYDFPRQQAMMARLNSDDQTSARFEVYFRHLELGNGFYELNDPKEQKARFTADNRMRSKLKLKVMPYDEALLDSLAFLPPCSGVALGLDRLLLLLSKLPNFNFIFPFRKSKE